MNTRRLAASGICTAALLCAAAAASAQAVYRHVNLSGGITYTDQPEPALPSDRETAPEPDAAQAPARRPYVSPRLAATVNANEAGRRLAQAEFKRRQGVKPLPGEQVRRGKAMVPNYRYWQRQEKLRLLVEQAQRRLSATRQPQFAAR